MNGDKDSPADDQAEEELELKQVPRKQGDRRSMNFYDLYSEEELKKMPPDRRKEDRRETD